MGRTAINVAVIAATAERSAESKVVRNCAESLTESGAVVALVAKRLPGMRGWWRESLRAVAKCDVAVFHSPLVYSAPLVVWGKLLRKPIVSLVWDVYPVRLSGRRYDKRLSRRAVDWIELICLRLSDLILVPSPDFLRDPSLANAEFEPLWAAPQSLSKHPETGGPGAEDGPGQVLQILFAGQVNATRGLDMALAKLERVLPVPFMLKVASYSELPARLLAHPKVDFVGGLSTAELAATAAECNFGLVSLAPDLDGAGFPSKAFEYLAFGLPILYFGPRLEFFTGLLVDAGVGIDVTDLTELPLERLHAVAGACRGGRRRFLERTVLKPGRMRQLLSRFEQQE